MFEPARAGFKKTHFGLNQKNAASQMGLSLVRRVVLTGCDVWKRGGVNQS
jgi:hypothetical protein